MPRRAGFLVVMLAAVGQCLPKGLAPIQSKRSPGFGVRKRSHESGARVGEPCEASSGHEQRIEAGEVTSTREETNIRCGACLRGTKDGEVDGDWTRPLTWSPRQRRKALSLCVLTLQNSALTLTMRYSRTRTAESTYLASEAVVMAEMLKALTSLVFAALVLPADCSISRRIATAARDAYTERGSYVLLVPAALYAVQNNLQYVAASNLEPAVFQVLYQMKLLTTAFFSVLLLRRRLATSQLAAIALLAAGLGLASVGAKAGQQLHLGHTASASAFATGFAAVFAACCTSGFSSVYFERVVKARRKQQRHSISVWACNAQLATFSSTIAALGAFLKDGAEIRRRGFLTGFSPLVWSVVALQAGGGLCTAAVIAYADNLLKGFATGVSMLLCSLASCIWFDFGVTTPFVLGAVAVIAAMFLYRS